MRVRAILFVLLLFAAAESPAYVVVSRVATSGPTGPDSGTASMVFTGTNLHFENIEFREAGATLPVIGTPVVSITGNGILVTQSYQPPVTASGTYEGLCQVEDVTVGALAPGIYNVTWSYVTPSGRTDIARLMRMDVTPCSGTPRPGEPAITLTPTIAGTALLHIECIVNVSDPTFGTPSITSKGSGGITVHQPLSDSSTVSATMCRAEDLELGTLAPGPWSIQWLYDTNHGVMGGAGASFVWSGVAPLCTSSGIFWTSPFVPASTAPVTLVFSRATVQTPSDDGQTTSVNGDLIGVHDAMILEGPIGPTLPPIHCYTSRATVPALPAGSYAVKWNVVARGPDLTTLDSFHFNVAQGRRRAARR